RRLVARQALLAEGDELRFTHLRLDAVLQYDAGLDGLAAVVVRHPDHRRHPDAGMAIQYFLDLARPDLEAGRVDHVLLAINDGEVALGIHAGDVAGMQPAVDERRGRLVRPVPVAAHDLGAANEQLTVLPERQVGATGRG